jgi:hypothetical protein
MTWQRIKHCLVSLSLVDRLLEAGKETAARAAPPSPISPHDGRSGFHRRLDRFRYDWSERTRAPTALKMALPIAGATTHRRFAAADRRLSVADDADVEFEHLASAYSRRSWSARCRRSPSWPFSNMAIEAPIGSNPRFYALLDDSGRVSARASKNPAWINCGCDPPTPVV